MKLFKKISYYFLGAGSPASLMWVVPLLMIVPNVVLDFTEVQYTTAERLTNVLLPLGVYLLLLAWSRNIGRSVLFCLPIMVLCSFQLVLTGLYHEAIIAVDMFLNVVTTNMSEATELLGQLNTSIALVCALYLPPLVAAAMFVVRRQKTTAPQRRAARIAGLALAFAGIVTMTVSLCSGEGYRVERRLFPVNVIANMKTAAQRSRASAHYFETSRDFTFNASSDRSPSEREIYVMVVGETSRADNWQLFGYGRPTNPHLSQRYGLTAFGKTLSESNTTHKSVPLMLSHLHAVNFGDSINKVKSVIEAFNEAGYATAWISNQQRNNSYIDFFGEEATHAEFIVDDRKRHYDMELPGRLRRFIDRQFADSTGSKKVFVVLHTYGSHFNYKERYPTEFNAFTPDVSAKAEARNRPELLNAYDNTILYTDAVLDSIISTIDSYGCSSAVVYTSDHGEDIYDDDRKRFLHASPNPTYWQLHVPMLVWISQTYADRHPEHYVSLRKNKNKNVASSRSIFHTLMSLSGISTPLYDPGAAVSEDAYTEPNRHYLNDYNEATGLYKCGFKYEDFEKLMEKNIRAY